MVEYAGKGCFLFVWWISAFVCNAEEMPWWMKRHKQAVRQEGVVHLYVWGVFNVDRDPAS